MSNTIQAAVFRGESNEAKIETLHVQEFRDDEVLVKLVATGICHTDLKEPLLIQHNDIIRVTDFNSHFPV